MTERRDTPYARLKTLVDAIHRRDPHAGVWEEIDEADRVTLSAAIDEVFPLAVSETGLTATLEESNRCYLEQFDRAEKLVKELAAKQAHLDRVMLEHCPDEMTPEQIENWKKHQAVSHE